MQCRVSLAELIDNDVPLRPDEAAAIVREVCRQYAAGDLRGIPNPTVIRLTEDGSVLVEGPVNRDHSPVPAAAALLHALLPGYDSATGFKVPGGLRLVLARAAGTIDLPPFTSIDDFCSALDRFAAPDLTAVARSLFQSGAARQAAQVCTPSKELTISDVRRARRATGLSLEDVSRGSAIPAPKLRELEWGYVRHWHADAAGRDDLRRYARAAGLDEDLVVSVAWPMIESDASPPAESTAADLPETQAGWALVPVESTALTPAARPAVRRPSPWLQHRWALALAAAVLLVVAALVTGWERPTPMPSVAPVARALQPAEPPAIPETIPSTIPASIDGGRPTPGTGVRPATYTRPVPVRRSAQMERPAPPRTRGRTPPAKPSRSSHQSFFKKELFRIVIR
jgi:Helix-turn-helix domain